eukprot:GHVQ01000512.1.p2 GENE.GHVQ01000512.1~~GHVQ01000512.1.p2  ORF type:complete len:109 (-),score=18.28 GHVQ01000512.1:41-367(-)
MYISNLFLLFLLLLLIRYYLSLLIFSLFISSSFVRTPLSVSIAYLTVPPPLLILSTLILFPHSLTNRFPLTHSNIYHGLSTPTTVHTLPPVRTRPPAQTLTPVHTSVA